jgi:tetratricopeptide (TPR) repeat protein
LVDRARFYWLIGRRDEAIRDVRRALSLPAAQPQALEGAVRLCLESGSRTLIGEAEAAVDKVRSAEPNDADLKLLKVELVLSRITRSSMEQGQRLLREITAAEPELSRAWLLLGRLELGQGQPGRALDSALGGLSYNDHDKQLLLLKADAEAVRSPALAVPTLKLLAESYPDDAEVEMRLARALYLGGSKDSARSMLDARVKAEPNNPVPLATLADLLTLDERWAEIAERVAKWLSKHPDDAGVVSAVARSLTVTNKAEATKMAEDFLNAALERNPKSMPALASLGLLLQSTGREQEAAAINRRILDIDPNDLIALNNLAWVLCEEDGQCQEALELAERGLRIAPDYLDLVDTRGVIHYRLGHLEMAVADLSRCIELYPDGARSAVACHFHLGRVYAKMGRRTQAQQELKRAMDLRDRVGGLSQEDLTEAKALLEGL